MHMFGAQFFILNPLGVLSSLKNYLHVPGGQTEQVQEVVHHVDGQGEIPTYFAPTP